MSKQLITILKSSKEYNTTDIKNVNDAFFNNYIPISFIIDYLNNLQNIKYHNKKNYYYLFRAFFSLQLKIIPLIKNIYCEKNINIFIEINETLRELYFNFLESNNIDEFKDNNLYILEKLYRLITVFKNNNIQALKDLQNLREGFLNLETNKINEYLIYFNNLANKVKINDLKFYKPNFDFFAINKYHQEILKNLGDDENEKVIKSINNYENFFKTLNLEFRENKEFNLFKTKNILSILNYDIYKKSNPSYQINFLTTLDYEICKNLFSINIKEIKNLNSFKYIEKILLIKNEISKNQEISINYNILINIHNLYKNGKKNITVKNKEIEIHNYLYFFIKNYWIKTKSNLNLSKLNLEKAYFINLINRNIIYESRDSETELFERLKHHKFYNLEKIIKSIDNMKTNNINIIYHKYEVFSNIIKYTPSNTLQEINKKFIAMIGQISLISKIEIMYASIIGKNILFFEKTLIDLKEYFTKSNFEVKPPYNSLVQNLIFSFNLVKNNLDELIKSEKKLKKLISLENKEIQKDLKSAIETLKVNQNLTKLMLKLKNS